MKLSYIIGGAGSGKSYQAYRRVIEQSIQNPEQNFLVIVPDQFTMQTQRDLVTMHPKRGIMNIDVLSFGRLAHRIFDNSGSKKPVLDDTGKSLVLRLVTGKIADRLPMLGGNLHKQGYIHEMKSAISEFMQYGINPDKLAELNQGIVDRKTLRGKMEDLEVVYREFLDYIGSRYITTEESLQVLARQISSVDFIKDSVIVLDGFTGFTPVQYGVIEELLRYSAEVIVTVLNGAENNAYARGTESDLFYLSTKTINDLDRMAERIGAVRDAKSDVVLPGNPVYRHRNNPAMAALERDLFRVVTRKEASEDNSSNADCIHIRQAQNPREELEYVARQIHRLTTEQGMSYRDIAVLTGSMETYGIRAREAFEALNIPYYLDKTNHITQNPCAEFIRNGLQVVLQNFSYESVFQFLRSGFTGIERDAVDRFENYCMAQGVRGKKKYSEPFLRYTKDIEGDAAALQELNDIRSRFMQLMEPLLQKCTIMGEYVKTLYSFMHEAGLEQKLCEVAESFKAQEEYALEREYSQIYRVIMGLLEQLYALLADEKLSMQDFADILDSGLNELKVGTVPQSVDRVVVGDLERTRLKDIRVLFCVGMNDGNVPQNASKGGIISNLDREALTEQGWELAPGPRQKMFIQRMYLYMNVTRPTDALWLSYAAVDNAGKSLRKSYFIDTIRHTCPGCDMAEIMPGGLEDIASVGQGESLLAQYLHNARNAEKVDEEQFVEELETLYRVLFEQADEAEFQEISRLVESAIHGKNMDSIGAAVARILYGQTLYNSVSRLETFVKCSFMHFLQYGLHLREQVTFEYDARDLGTMYHTVLEQFGKALRESEYDWDDFPEEFANRVISQTIESAAGEYSNAIFYSSERNKYVLHRMGNVMKKTIMALKDQMKTGKFRPQQFELSFSAIEDLDAVTVQLNRDEKMLLSGSIDRVDTYSDDERVYVKVLDYKSGNRDFDLVSVYHGLSLQLVVYLNAAMAYEQQLSGGKEVVPAALLYYKMQDPLVDRTGADMQPEDIDRKIREKLKMTGVVNDNDTIQELLDSRFRENITNLPLKYTSKGALSKTSNILSTEQFRLVSDYVQSKVQELGNRIMDGDIAAKPHIGGMHIACDYCGYREACRFDKRNNEERGWTETKMDDEVVLACMEAYVKGEV